MFGYTRHKTVLGYRNKRCWWTWCLIVLWHQTVYY